MRATPPPPMQQSDLKLYLFVFLLRLCLFVVIGIVLHSTNGVPHFCAACPGLWESMTMILSAKCVRMTICRAAMHRFEIRIKTSDCVDMFVHFVYFCVECVLTSVSLNSSACVESMSSSFGGHPLIAYVNGIACVWDGCSTLAFSAFVTFHRRSGPDHGMWGRF